MQFYCPVCLTTVDTEPTSTVTTKLNRVAYKALCPVCNQDLAFYSGEAAEAATPEPPTPEAHA
jgi:hypothetical protein